MNEMARGSIGAMALEGLKRGMSYGQYVAARYYPVRICQVQADGSTILRSAAMPEVLPGWEETVARRRSRCVDGKVRRSRAKKPKPEKAEQAATGRKCAVCGAELGSGQRLYCGEVCKKKASSQRYYQRKKAGLVKLPPRVERVTRECGVCGRSFETAMPHQKYCGAECSERARYVGNKLRWLAELEQRPKKHCIACGVELVGRQIKYCTVCADRERARQNRERNRG